MTCGDSPARRNAPSPGPPPGAPRPQGLMPKHRFPLPPARLREAQSQGLTRPRSLMPKHRFPLPPARLRAAPSPGLTRPRSLMPKHRSPLPPPRWRAKPPDGGKMLRASAQHDMWGLTSDCAKRRAPRPKASTRRREAAAARSQSRSAAPPIGLTTQIFSSEQGRAKPDLRSERKGRERERNLRFLSHPARLRRRPARSALPLPAARRTHPEQGQS